MEKTDYDYDECLDDYTEDIHTTLRASEKEVKHINYTCSVQKNSVNDRMRGILVDWMMAVCNENKFSHETMFLSITYMDQYLSIQTTHKNKLQLLGAVCIFIASKYEEEPDYLKVKEIEHITVEMYPRSEILNMEKAVLQVLDYRLLYATPPSFLSIYLNQICSYYTDSDVKKIRSLSCYLIELSLMNYKLSYTALPSMIAATAVYTAIKIVIKEDDIVNLNNIIINRTGYDPSWDRISELYTTFVKMFKEAPIDTLKTFLKYASRTHFNVANIKLREDVDIKK